MKRVITCLAIAALIGGCADSQDQGDLGSLSSAFQTIPLGFDNPEHSFPTPPGDVPLWGPEKPSFNSGPGLDKRGPGPNHGPGQGHGIGLPFIMGGGLHDLFIGGGWGLKFGKRPFGHPVLYGNCPFDAAAGRVVCDPVLRGGLTINRSASYADANGTVQPAFDSATTDVINVRVTVSGTISRRDDAKSDVQGASDRTVSGLRGAQRTVNGTSAGQENTTGTREGKAFTALRVAGDTINGVVVPVPTSATERTYPTAGTIIRAMQVTVTFEGESPRSSSRREVITYDGSSTARVVITHDGTTKNCTLPLPKGRLNCA